MIRQLRSLFELSGAERNTKLRDRLTHRFNLYTGRFIYSSFGYWLNRGHSRYALHTRPDSHNDFARFEDYPRLFKLWVANNHEASCGDLSRFYALYLNVCQVLNDAIPGDLVELGVYKGNSASILASLARRHQRHVFLFDTFGGFDQRDLRGIDSQHKVGQFADTSLQKVQQLVGTDSVTFVQGFFPESTSHVTMPDKIAVAHIDCDLYEPMKAGLEWFYSRLSPGGIMLLHDYSSGHWPGATRAIDEFFRDRPEKPILLPDKGGSAVIRKATPGS